MTAIMRREIDRGVHPSRAVGQAFPGLDRREWDVAWDLAWEDAAFIIHPWRSGGTSLHRALTTSGVSPRLLGGPTSDIGWLPASLPYQAIVFGNFAYGIHRRYRGAPRYGVMLRDPIERCWSVHRHIRQQLAMIRSVAPAADCPGPLLWRADTLSVGDMAARGEPELNNRVTAMIAGRSLRGPDDNEALEIATNRLVEFEWLAILGERLNLTGLSGFVGAPVVALPRLNSAPDETLSPRDRSKLEALNGLDIRLYEFARDLVGRR